MAIDPQKPGGPYEGTINPRDKADLESWAQVFGVTFTQVRAATTIVGNKAGDVHNYLKKQGWTK